MAVNVVKSFQDILISPLWGLIRKMIRMAGNNSALWI